jgi:hypothetical protein
LLFHFFEHLAVFCAVTTHFILNGIENDTDFFIDLVFEHELVLNGVGDFFFDHLEMIGFDHFGVDEVLDCFASEIPDVFARKNHWSGGESSTERREKCSGNALAQMHGTCENNQAMAHDNLLGLKDDMVAFITGHGLRQFPGFVGDDVPSVLWEDQGDPDDWKRLVETAKAAGAAFLTLSDMVIEEDELEMLLEKLREQNFPDEDAPEFEQVESLRAHVGKVGYLQLGFVHQGVAFLHETASDWYEQYEDLIEAIDEFSLGDVVFDEEDEEEN